MTTINPLQLAQIKHNIKIGTSRDQTTHLSHNRPKNRHETDPGTPKRSQKAIQKPNDMKNEFQQSQKSDTT